MTIDQAKEEIVQRFPKLSSGLSLYPIYAYPDDPTPAWIGIADGHIFLVDGVSLEHYKLSTINIISVKR